MKHEIILIKLKQEIVRQIGYTKCQAFVTEMLRCNSINYLEKNLKIKNREKTCVYSHQLYEYKEEKTTLDARF